MGKARLDSPSRAAKRPDRPLLEVEGLIIVFITLVAGVVAIHFGGAAVGIIAAAATASALATLVK